MSAVVLNHEEAHEQPRRERRHNEREPVLTVARRNEHRGPERDEGQDRDREFKDSARRTRPAVRDERLRPVARRHSRAISVHRRHSQTPTRALEQTVVERVVDCARKN